jgi:hypothetical protein
MKSKYPLMQFEEFDDKVKEAADNHHPAYSEQAWSKMEKLLDTHMPQKKEDDKRPVFFLLLLLLAGGGLFILLNNNKSKSISSSSQQNEQKTIIKKNSTFPKTNTQYNQLSEPIDNLSSGGTNPVLFPQHDNNDVRPSANKSLVDLDKHYQSINLNSTGKNKLNKEFLQSTNDKEKNNSNPDLKTLTNAVSGNLSDVSGKTQLNNVAGDKKDQAVTVKKDVPVNKVTESQSPVAKENAVNKTNANPVTNNPAEKSNSKPDVKVSGKKRNEFFISGSTGLDASYIPDEKMGKVKLTGGLSAGYRLGNGLSFSAGIFTGRKVYSSSAKGYNPPNNFWIYYPYLEKVNANCKVYEVPVTVAYNFKNRNKGNLFVAAGASSLFMKEETYDYSYKTNPTGPLLDKQWTLYNQNKHYFSLLTLSGGYNRQIGKHSSISIAPYMKIPLTGIGYGKVKLNSGGLMVSVNLSPFRSAKKK